MRTRLLVLTIALLVPVVANAITEGPDPVGLAIAQAKITGNTVTVPVSNSSTAPIDVEVVGHYDDGSQVHSASVVVSLGPKGSALVGVQFGSVVGSIDPLTRIVDDMDPFTNAIALGGALWVD